MSASSKSSSKWASGPAIVLYLAAAKLLLHLLTAGRYGIFRDELYYLACAEHLDWGYVDQPPAIALIAKFARHVFGSSLLGLRLLPAIAGAALVWLAGNLTREMGGQRFAQALAALATLAAAIFLLFHHWLTMNAFEPLIWIGAAWCVVRAINPGPPAGQPGWGGNTGRANYWLWFGVIIGVGLETKYSVIFFAFGIVVGLILTPERRFLKSKWIWLGALAALVIFLPNLLWLVKHDFPFLELMRNIRESGRDVTHGPLGFIAEQALIMNPMLFPLWVGGLVWLFFGTEGRRYRIFGWAYVMMLVTFIVLKGKNYYLAPVYPILFAAGAIAFERLTVRTARGSDRGSQEQAAGAGGRSLRTQKQPSAAAARSPSELVHLPSAPASCSWALWLRYLYVALIIVGGASLAPLTLPILSPETYIRYQAALGFEPPKAENQNTGPLPQHFADEFGWEEMTRAVAEVYNSLSPEERAQTAIFANSYGQAGAIDFFGAKFGLPKAISNHQNYWYWGPRNYTGAIVIVLGSDGDGDREHFKTVHSVGRTYHPYSRRDEHFEIFLCRGLNQDLRTLWPTIKKWD
ncbi:MAG: glycosyltransferase family 39 protein [Acidobacteriota bacterium]|nr:glycosyltransferase family 39 protein [Acidobacteriota bacterium]